MFVFRRFLQAQKYVQRTASHSSIGFELLGGENTRACFRQTKSTRMFCSAPKIKRPNVWRNWTALDTAAVGIGVLLGLYFIRRRRSKIVEVPGEMRAYLMSKRPKKDKYF
eukprot:488557_1